MKTLSIRWFATLALSTAALAGCSSRSDATEVPLARPAIAAAPVTLRPDPPAAQAPAAACPIPVNVAATQSGTATSPAPVKATKPVVKEDANLRVKRLVIAQGVSKHEPVDAATTFSVAEADRIYAFVELENEDRASSEVTVTFVPPSGKAPIGNVTLDVGAQPRWRTWAYTRGARQEGKWTAVVRSMSGKVLAKAPFEITK